MRTALLSLQGRGFVEAARCIGMPGGWLVVHPILPNAFGSVIVTATLR